MKDKDFIEAELPVNLPANHPKSPLVEGRDYYAENGLYVFTASYLAGRGYCCGSGCRHCPYPKEMDE